MNPQPQEEPLIRVPAMHEPERPSLWPSVRPGRTVAGGNRRPLKPLLILCLLAMAIALPLPAKEFTNLNFDEGIPALPPFDQPQAVDLLLPGWTARMGDQELSHIGWNANNQTYGGVSVFVQPTTPTFEGRYGMYLSGGPLFPSLSPDVPASISQTGLIPPTANSLLFRAEFFSPTEVTLAGQVVPYQFLQEIKLGEFNSTKLYGVDVRSFAGQEAELSFINYARPDRSGAIFFDSLTFSTAVVPEPSTWALVLLGGVALCWVGRRPPATRDPGLPQKRTHRKPLVILCLLAMASALPLRAKEFTNLNFDEGGFPQSPIDGPQSSDLLLPGWTARVGDQVLSEIRWNFHGATYGRVSILTRSSRPTVFEGRYGMYLSGGPVFSSLSPDLPASISQAGLIPATANSLLFRADIGSPTEVTLGGQVVPYQFLGEIALGDFGSTSLYGVDVRRFAGQEVELSFINYRQPNSVDVGAIYLDSLTFSTAVVPEPSTWALVLLGGWALCWVGRRPPATRDPGQPRNRTPRKPLLILCLLAMASALPLRAKEFTNLNFDEGGSPQSPLEGPQPVELLLPGWTVRMGDHQLSHIGWNQRTPTYGGVSVFVQPTTPAFEGRYGMYLSGGPMFPSLSPDVPASISQTGLIPANANSLLFRANIGSPTEVTLGGQVVPYQFLGEIPVGQINSTRVYGVDVRSFSGLEVELSFINYRRPNSVDVGAIFFDSLTFSTAVVPEPSTWALVVLGGWALCCVGRRPPATRDPGQPRNRTHRNPLLILCLLAMASTLSLPAKEFTNLNFDEGILPPPPFEQLQPADLILPGWTAKMGDQKLSYIGWNAERPTHGGVSILSQPLRPTVIEGRYGMYLSGGPVFPSLSPDLPASISQTGLIPATANSLLFRADIFSPTEVTLSGQVVPYQFLGEIALGDFGSTSLYGVDVRSFSGQEVELSFINYVRPNDAGAIYFDGLTFSTAVVPEPATWALVLLGGVALCWVGRRPS